MQQRFDVETVSPDSYNAMLGLHAAVQKSGLDASLLELVKIRVSQINGCAFCIAMHVAIARKLEVSEDRMHLLSAWREAPIYSLRERAALAWAESLARLSDGGPLDSVYEEARQAFTEKEIADLAFAVVEIGGWNRLMIASRTPPQIETVVR
jgi:AhpD family alkylhydroperoxidase